MIDFLKDIIAAREPGEGFFGGAEGAIRFVLLILIVGGIFILYYFL